MKYTQYFLYTRKRPDRILIKNEWLQKAIDNPIHTQIQSDGRIRKWVRIPEKEKYLRIILLPDGETVHNAFFDRNFKMEVKDEN
ncbi:MAG: hypothetical protein E3K37_00605 [Candidatus Kuenenia sp.]|nr:hypothetical protein [Candidatus Kuenenia hertensis]